MKTEEEIRDAMIRTKKAKTLVKTVVKNKKERILAETIYETKVRIFNWILKGDIREDENFHICQKDKIVYYGSWCPICKSDYFVPTLTKEMIYPTKE